MLISGTIKCPCCLNESGSLMFWKKIEDIENGKKIERYFHVCQKCNKRGSLSNDELLRIGFYHGEESFKSKVSEFINQQ